MSEPTFYDRLGGEEAVRALVDRFYDAMDRREDAVAIRAMHAKSLASSRQKLFMFLSGWLGGPSLYIEKYGHPRLRMRHFPFPIDQAAADAWIRCMDEALEGVEDEPLRDFLAQRFRQVADHMRNREG
jgi:hemoglobin